MDTIEVDAFVPDPTGQCCVCGQSPTVTAVKAGKIVNEWDLCGPCCFGTAKALDPATWNS